jgi:hypothetical protein
MSLAQMVAITDQAVHHSEQGAQPAPEPAEASAPRSRTERELTELGLLPTAEYPVFYRPLEGTGFALFLYLDRALDLQTLQTLAESSDLSATLQALVAGNRA